MLWHWTFYNLICPCQIYFSTSLSKYRHWCTHNRYYEWRIKMINKIMLKHCVACIFPWPTMHSKLPHRRDLLICLCVCRTSYLNCFVLFLVRNLSIDPLHICCNRTLFSRFVFNISSRFSNCSLFVNVYGERYLLKAPSHCWVNSAGKSQMMTFPFMEMASTWMQCLI